MKNKLAKVNSGCIILTILFFLSALIVFKFWHDHGLQYPHSIYDFGEINDFEINPHTILSDINQGKKDVFKPIVDDSEQANNLYASDSFSWLQSDYLKVATILHQHVWNEALDDWKIYSMKFYRDCQNDPVGFSSADITYYKYNNQTGGYKVHEMTIHPNGGRVGSGITDDWSRPLFGWKSINSHLLKVSADNALHIAEEYGGKEFRIKYKNECNIMLILKPNPSNSDDWLVYYDYQGSLKTFEIVINPYTGWH